MRSSVAVVACLACACLERDNPAFGVISEPGVAATPTAPSTDPPDETTTTPPPPTDGSADATSTTTTDATSTTTSTSSTTSTTDPTTSSTTTTTTTGKCEPGELQPCYTGPPSTQDIGICTAGTMLCDETGEWGPCDGEVLPAAKDDCGTVTDENCDGAPNDGCVCEPGMMADCYTGPPGTEGVGPCKAGKWKCTGQGNWGECLGQTLPQPDDCDAPKDKDCDGAIICP